MLLSFRYEPLLLPSSLWLRIYSSLQNICLIETFWANVLVLLEIETLAYLGKYFAHTIYNLFTYLGLLERTIDILMTMSYIIHMHSVANFYKLELFLIFILMHDSVLPFCFFQHLYKNFPKLCCLPSDPHLLNYKSFIYILCFVIVANWQMKNLYYDLEILKNIS